jgi:hypothetical protein
LAFVEATASRRRFLGSFFTELSWMQLSHSKLLGLFIQRDGG